MCNRIILFRYFIHLMTLFLKHSFNLLFIKVFRNIFEIIRLIKLFVLFFEILEKGINYHRNIWLTRHYFIPIDFMVLISKWTLLLQSWKLLLTSCSIWSILLGLFSRLFFFFFPLRFAPSFNNFNNGFLLIFF